MDIVHIDKFRYEIQEQRKFQYGTFAYRGPFRALLEGGEIPFESSCSESIAGQRLDIPRRLFSGQTFIIVTH
jgi:hypothetical protein